MKRKPFTLESWMMVNGKTDDVFYSEKSSRHLTAIAAMHDRKIKTQRMVAVKPAPSDLQVENITKITLL